MTPEIGLAGESATFDPSKILSGTIFSKRNFFRNNYLSLLEENDTFTYEPNHFPLKILLYFSLRLVGNIYTYWIPKLS